MGARVTVLARASRKQLAHSTTLHCALNELAAPTRTRCDRRHEQKREPLTQLGSARLLGGMAAQIGAGLTCRQADHPEQLVTQPEIRAEHRPGVGVARAL